MLKFKTHTNSLPRYGGGKIGPERTDLPGVPRACLENPKWPKMQNFEGTPVYFDREKVKTSKTQHCIVIKIGSTISSLKGSYGKIPFQATL